VRYLQQHDILPDFLVAFLAEAFLATFFATFLAAFFVATVGPPLKVHGRPGFEYFKLLKLLKDLPFTKLSILLFYGCLVEEQTCFYSVEITFCLVCGKECYFLHNLYKRINIVSTGSLRSLQVGGFVKSHCYHPPPRE